MSQFNNTQIADISPYHYNQYSHQNLNYPFFNIVYNGYPNNKYPSDPQFTNSVLSNNKYGYYPNQSKKSSKKIDAIQNDIKADENGYCKPKIIEWLKKMSVQERYKLFKIQDLWFVSTMIKMHWKEKKEGEHAYAKIQMLKDPGEDLAKNFYCRKIREQNEPEKQRFKDIFKEVLEEIRIIDDNQDLYSTICFDIKFLEDVDELIEKLDILSERSLFQSNLNFQYDNQTKTYNVEMPLWFNVNSFQSMASWIVSTYEKTIFLEYYKDQKEQKNKHSSSSTDQAALSQEQYYFSYQQNVFLFWKNLEKSKKQQIIESCCDIYKDFITEIPQATDNNKKDKKGSKQSSKQKAGKNQQSQQQTTQNGNQKPVQQECHYDTRIRHWFKKTKEHNQIQKKTQEGLQDFLKKFLDDDESLMRHIFATTLEDTTSEMTLVIKKMFQQIQVLYQEKTQQDLIQQEELEKNGKKQSQSKKKKNKKKKNKNNNNTQNGQNNNNNQNNSNKQKILPCQKTIENGKIQQDECEYATITRDIVDGIINACIDSVDTNIQEKQKKQQITDEIMKKQQKEAQENTNTTTNTSKSKKKKKNKAKKKAENTAAQQNAQKQQEQEQLNTQQSSEETPLSTTLQTKLSKDKALTNPKTKTDDEQSISIQNTIEDQTNDLLSEDWDNTTLTNNAKKKKKYKKKQNKLQNQNIIQKEKLEDLTTGPETYHDNNSDSSGKIYPKKSLNIENNKPLRIPNKVIGKPVIQNNTEQQQQQQQQQYQESRKQQNSQKQDTKISNKSQQQQDKQSSQNPSRKEQRKQNSTNNNNIVTEQQQQQQQQIASQKSTVQPMPLDILTIEEPENNDGEFIQVGKKKKNESSYYQQAGGSKKRQPYKGKNGNNPRNSQTQNNNSSKQQQQSKSSNSSVINTTKSDQKNTKQQFQQDQTKIKDQQQQQSQRKNSHNQQSKSTISTTTNSTQNSSRQEQKSKKISIISSNNETPQKPVKLIQITDVEPKENSEQNKQQQQQQQSSKIEQQQQSQQQNSHKKSSDETLNNSNNNNTETMAPLKQITKKQQSTTSQGSQQKKAPLIDTTTPQQPINILSQSSDSEDNFNENNNNINPNQNNHYQNNNMNQNNNNSNNDSQYPNKHSSSNYHHSNSYYKNKGPYNSSYSDRKKIYNNPNSSMHNSESSNLSRSGGGGGQGGYQGNRPPYQKTSYYPKGKKPYPINPNYKGNNPMVYNPQDSTSSYSNSGPGGPKPRPDMGYNSGYYSRTKYNTGKSRQFRQTGGYNNNNNNNNSEDIRPKKYYQQPVSDENQVYNLAKSTFQKTIQSDIKEFVQKLNDTSNQLLESRQIISERIKHFVTHLFNNETYQEVTTRIYGSCATGLTLPTSDVDIGLVGFQQINRDQMQTVLQQLLEQLLKMKWVVQSEAIYTATIPIIKLAIDPRIGFKELKNQSSPVCIIDEDQEYGQYNLKTVPQNWDDDIIIKIDITIEPWNIQGGQGYQSTDFMERWINYLTPLHPLTILTKCFLQVRKFNNPYKGGISSYGLIIMLIAFLKERTQNSDLQSLLMELLNFYGNNFNPNTTSINLQNQFSSFQPTHQDLECKLQVFEPLSFNLIITKNCYQIETIQQEFSEFNEQLVKKNREIQEKIEKFSAVELEEFDNMDLKNQRKKLQEIIGYNVIENIIFNKGILDNNPIYKKMVILKQEENNNNIINNENNTNLNNNNIEEQPQQQISEFNDQQDQNNQLSQNSQ